MKLKRNGELVVVAVGVLVLLAAAAWYSGQPDWQPMPESLTKPSPDFDRGRIPLGPYTVDFSGLIGGPTGKDIVTFYVVMKPGDVHFQRVGEVGKRLEDEGAVAVTGLSVSLKQAFSGSVTPNPQGELVDGLLLLEPKLKGRPHFFVLNTRDASGRPIRVICSLNPQALKILTETYSFLGIESGSCGARFYPRQDLYSFLGAIPPEMMPEMASFLPELYQQVSERVRGAP